MFDAAVIANHFMMLHKLARGLSGKLVLAVFSESAPPQIHHFAIGDMEGMTHAALRYQSVPGANVYAPLAVMREDLAEGLKGKEEDIVAVLGCVIDDDADKGKGAQLPVSANYTLRSSRDNRQFFLFFDRPLPPAEAKQLGKAMKRATGADCASDISHVWRVPGSLNFPTASKISRGRDATPFPVSVAMQWEVSSLTNVEKLREVLAPHFEVATTTSTAVVAAPRGEYHHADVASMISFMNEFGAFEDREKWIECGMALKLEFGDDGLELWRIAHDNTVTLAAEATAWKSFKSEPKSGCVTLRTLMKETHQLGWKGSIGKSVDSMFAGAVESLAHNAGATLPADTPLPANASAGGMPMLAGQQALCDLAAPILVDFLKNTADRCAPQTADCPALPETAASHGLYALLNESIARVIALAVVPKLWKQDRECVIEPLAILQIVHADTFDAVRRKLISSGRELPDRKIKHAAVSIADRVQRQFVSDDAWHYGPRGDIEADNPDNICALLGVIGCEVRWNGWRERLEIRGGNDPELAWLDWTSVDDAAIAKLSTRAKRTGTRFRPAKEFIWDTLLALAQRNPTDPVIDRLAELQSDWDQAPRLDTWLSKVCGVPDDAYHRAVARNIIGGMVRRARKPGCKHDTMAVLFGGQGTGKSTLASILALSLDWFSDSIKLGEASKELVLLLAGKLVVEISEMGMRGSANASDIKAMISRQTDAGRTAYARAVSERQRRNIFLGSTNENEPLSDPTGNRRFLPVRCDSELDLAYLRANIGQLVGEAATIEAAGDDFSIPREVWTLAAEHTEAVRSESDTEVRLAEWFSESEHTKIAFVSTADLVELCHLSGLRGSGAYRSAIMKRLGFRQEKVYLHGAQKRIWYRGPEVLPKHIGREAARYLIGTDGNGRPRVTIRIDYGPSIVPPAMPERSSGLGPPPE